jgi:hypothetical protein
MPWPDRMVGTVDGEVISFFVEIKIHGHYCPCVIIKMYWLKMVKPEVEITVPGVSEKTYTSMYPWVPSQEMRPVA